MEQIISYQQKWKNNWHKVLQLKFHFQMLL